MSIAENDEKLIYEVEIKELVKRVFEKARKDSRETSKSGLSKYIENEVNSQINQRTLVRYYNQYIEGNDGEINHNKSGFDIISKYLGYKDFADFCREVVSEQELIPEEKEDELIYEETTTFSKNNFRKAVAGIGITTILGLGSYFGLSSFAEPQCMYWDENHYEQISCEENLHPNIEKEVYNEQLLAHFKKIEVSDTTTFFEAGKAIVWYLKVDGEIEFYSAPGNHPLTGRQLKPVTHYIVNKYGK